MSVRHLKMYFFSKSGVSVCVWCFPTERDDDEYNSLTATIGDEVWLNCTSSSSIGTDVDWRYKPHIGQLTSSAVYQSGYLQHGFQQQRFTARKHNYMEYSLIISNVTVNDGGVYLCIEEKGQGRTHYYALNVTGIRHFIQFNQSIDQSIFFVSGNKNPYYLGLKKVK